MELIAMSALQNSQTRWHRQLHNGSAEEERKKEESKKANEDVLGDNVLEAVPVLVLVGGHDDLAALPVGFLEPFEDRRRRFAPLGDEDDERQRLQRLGQQPLKVRHHGVHQLLAERRVGLERARHRLEVQHRPERHQSNQFEPVVFTNTLTSRLDPAPLIATFINQVCSQTK